MKNIFLSVLVLLIQPISVLADSTWLILRYTSGANLKAGVALEKIEMKDMEQCELGGAKWMGSKETKIESARKRGYAYVCIEGK